MKKQSRAEPSPSMVMRTAALALPETQEGIACAGTSLEKRTIKVRGRAFLFLSEADAMLKLGDSLAIASEMALKKPHLYKVGAHGWVVVRFDDAEALPVNWIGESYRLLAPKALIASLKESVSASGSTSKKQSATKPKRQKKVKER
jgi:hypothetical protein